MADYASSRSAGTNSKRDAHFVRFTPEQNQELHEIAKRRGQTIQNFLHQAAITFMRKDDEDRRDVASRKRDEKERTRREKGGLSSPAPRGLGLRARYENQPAPIRPEDIPPEEEPQSSAPQVVIHNGPQGNSVSEVDRLATFVARGGPPGERDNRHRTAANILGATARDEAEKIALAHALDDKIKSIEGAAPPRAKSLLDFAADWLK